MRRIPAGRPLAAKLKQIFERQAGEVLSRLRANSWRTAPSLTAWTPVMEQVLSPYVKPYLLDGGHDAAATINRLLTRPRRRAWIKDSPLPARVAFDIFHPRVGEAIRRITFDFCEATNQTSVMEIGAALTQLRADLAEGLAEGEAIKKIAARVEAIFTEPFRAMRIARTEVNRAVHAGGLLSAQQSGVVKGLRWIAKSDACPLCLALQGAEVLLGEDFHYDFGRGSYAHVPHPPRHPSCTCSTEMVLMDQFAPKVFWPRGEWPEVEQPSFFLAG